MPATVKVPLSPSVFFSVTLSPMSRWARSLIFSVMTTPVSEKGTALPPRRWRRWTNWSSWALFSGTNR